MRRSRLDAVLRVAELRERVARGQVGLATAAALAAAEAAQTRELRLAEAPLTAGPTADLLAAASVRERRAASAAAERARALDAAEARLEALAGWSGAAQDARLLASLVEQQRLAADAAAERATQSLLDDLSASRRRAEEQV